MNDAAFEFFHFKTLSSTNNKAKELARKGKYNLVVTADKQIRGKGRFSRRWNSGLGGLYMTIVLKEKDLDKVKYLTFIASVAVVKILRKITKLNAQVKWPNDVLIDDRKVCGILTETITNKNNNYTLIGIGVNINQSKFPKSIIKKSTSLKIETNKNYNIKNISKIIIREFNNLYSYYDKKKYNEIINIWKEYSHTLGRKIRAETLTGTHIGKVVDVDGNCNLILKLKNGKLRKIVEGDIFTV